MHNPDNATPHNSDTYDRQIRLTIPHYEDIHAEILNFVKVQCPCPGTWLDTGCGTGSFIKKAQVLFPDTEFFIADPSEGMLLEASHNLTGCPYHLIGRCGTADLPGFTKRRFDVITAIQCHHYLAEEERNEAVRACFSLLNDRGFFVTSENIRPFSDEGIARSLSYWGEFQRQAGRTKAEIRDHLDRFDHEYFPITITGHLQCYHEAGFSVAEILWLSCLQGVFWCRK
ncbi:MAG: class I SAM-dependent methyltransferase [Methanoregula sp.]|jgi:tRNA (cmo5U34)-methyltransferase|uniref:class I SAM-dependent methyltransferase n=1 Tax=Methanoregula sp. TaxID=2052170 RepID=UPI003C20B193